MEVKGMTWWGRGGGRIRSPGRGRIGRTVALVVACELALACSWPPRAQASAPMAESNVELEVEIDPRIAGADDLVTWVDDEGRKTLAELPRDRERLGVVRVGIAGELYDYRITVTTLRGEEPVGEPSVWGCECSNEDLLERLRQELRGAADRLVVVRKKRRAPPPRIVGDGASLGDGPRRATRARLGPAGATGIALMVSGAAGIATGATFMRMDDTQSPDAEEFGQLSTTDHQRTAMPIVVAGAGLVATGLVLLVTRGRARSARASARVLPRWATSQGRFELGASASF